MADQDAVVLLRRCADRTAKDRSHLLDLLHPNLKAVRSMQLREYFEPIWRYRLAH